MALEQEGIKQDRVVRISILDENGMPLKLDSLQKALAMGDPNVGVEAFLEPREPSDLERGIRGEAYRIRSRIPGSTLNLSKEGLMDKIGLTLETRPASIPPESITALIIGVASMGGARGASAAIIEWIRHRKANLTLEIKRPDGASVKVSVTNVGDAEQMVNQLFSSFPDAAEPPRPDDVPSEARQPLPSPAQVSQVEATRLVGRDRWKWLHGAFGRHSAD